jgi:uncharacterized membrane protein YcaP (DUF421 family)
MRKFLDRVFKFLMILSMTSAAVGLVTTDHRLMVMSTSIMLFLMLVFVIMFFVRVLR